MAEAAENDGSEINPVLARLRLHSKELAKAAVAAEDVSGRKGTLAVTDRTLLRLHKQLDQQKSELQTRIGAGEVFIEEGSLEYLNEDNLQETAKQTEEYIEKLQVSYYNKTRALHSIQVFNAVQNTLLEENVESESLSKIITHSATTSCTILKEQQKTRELEKQLLELRMKREELKEKCTDLLTQLQDLAEKRRSVRKPREKKMEKIYSIMKEEMDSTTILQNVFQRLVFASQVDWAENPALREAVLKAGKDVNSF
ncbi:centromere protein H [Hyperolius riggenbachi]|uniref:centromere protein H n=1 Tax=Hyperolius riggenbachi TaxID=752182 RepID=UPI0035A35ED2